VVQANKARRFSYVTRWTKAIELNPQVREPDRVSKVREWDQPRSPRPVLKDDTVGRPGPIEERSAKQAEALWHRGCLKSLMFMKNSVSGISGFLDLAMVPLRSAAVIRGLQRRTSKEGRVVLLRNGDTTGASEELVFQGDPQVCPQRAEAVIARGERVVAEGLSIEQITALCSRHDYRWRFHPDRKPRLRFILEPALVPSATPQAGG